MKKTYDFLKKLKKNNKKEWFDKNRKEYDEAKAEFTQMVEDIIGRVGKFDKKIAGLEAKKTLFRINRDIRFSKDKSPYKTNFGSRIMPGKETMLNGYYLHVEPGNTFLAGGSYMPEPDKLNAIRQEIDYNYADFKKILSHKDYKKHFGGKLSDEEKLVNPPKGYEKDNPAIEILKFKHFLAYTKIEDKKVLRADFPKYAAEVFKAMHPLLVFLRKAIE